MHTFFISKSSLIILIYSVAIILSLFLYSIFNQLDSSFNIDNNGVINNIKNSDAIIHRHYHEEDVVTCLNRLSLFKKGRINDETLRIAFVGDSTIRNFLHSFVSVIPDYDMMKGAKTNLKFGYDRQVTSELLNLRVSFYWRHLANEKLLSTFRNWTIYNDTTPDYIFMGLLAHHIWNGSFPQFSTGMASLEPILKQLTTRLKIVWIVQPHGPDREEPDFPNKIPHYNKEARSILKNSGVVMSHLIEHIGLEYTRGCYKHGQFGRYHWHRCDDPIHTGHVVLAHGVQSVLNDLCNDLIDSDSIQPIQGRQEQESAC